MKKFLLSILPLLMGLTAFSAQAQSDFSVTLKWETPGSVEIYQGASNSGTKIELAADATEYVVTEKKQFTIYPAADYKIKSAACEGTAISLVQSKFFRLNLQGISDQGKYNGKTIDIVTEALVYTSSFELNVLNGADKLSFSIVNDGGSQTQELKPKDGEQTIKLLAESTKLVVSTQGFPRPELFTCTRNGQNVPYDVNANNAYIGSYTISLADSPSIVIALTDPNPEPATEFEVKIEFANNNPDCLDNIRQWVPDATFIYPADLAESNYTLKYTQPATLTFNLIDDATLNSITGVPALTETKYMGKQAYQVSENTTITIDATTLTYQDQTAVLYTNDVLGVLISNEYAGAPLTLTKIAEHPANTITWDGYTIPVATTSYTIEGINGKTGRFFFDTTTGYYLASGSRLQKAVDDETAISTSGSTLAECGSIFLNVAKIDYNTTAYVYFEGTDAAVARLRAGEGAYKNQTENLPAGYSEVVFDPGYNNPFTARMIVEGSVSETDNYYAYLDGTKLSASENSESVFDGIRLKANSMLKLFFGAAPTEHTLTFTEVGSSKATVSYDKYLTSNCTGSLKNVGAVTYTFTPATGTKIYVNGTELQAPYELKATAGEYNITIGELKPTLTFTSKPADGATVKELKEFTLLLPYTEEMMSTGTTPALSENPASYIKVSDGSFLTDIASVTMDEPQQEDPMDYNSAFVIPFVMTLDTPIDEKSTITITLKEGLVYTTVYDYDNDTTSRGADISAAQTFSVNVDPDYQYKWSFTPANGSEKNEIPEGDNVYITLSLPEANTLSEIAFDKSGAVGPWLTYNDTPLTKLDENTGKGQWMITPSTASNKLNLIILGDVFAKPGTLTMKADAGAFTVNGEINYATETVTGGEASPAIDYSASFGEKKEIAYTVTPTSGTTVDAADFKEITITFADATSVAIDSDYFFALFAQGQNFGKQLMETDFVIEGNTVKYTIPSDLTLMPGTWALSIDEGSFLIDGVNASPAVQAFWTVESSAAVSFDFTPFPEDGSVVNTGTSYFTMEVAFLFGESFSVSIVDRTAVEVTFNGATVPAYSSPDVMGYSLAQESSMPNAIMISVLGGDIQKKETTGDLTVTFPAGSLKINGQTNTEAVTYTWHLIAPKSYEVVVTPADGSTVAQIEEITVELKGATTATLYSPGFLSLKQGYMIASNISSVTPVADAENPTFKVALVAPVKTAGTYTFKMNMGAFTLDGSQDSPETTVRITVDPTLGVEGIYGDDFDGKVTVVSLSGIVLLQDADASELSTLPAGLYIVNGKKALLKK